MEGTRQPYDTQEPAVVNIGEEKSKVRKYKYLLMSLWNRENVKEEEGIVEEEGGEENVGGSVM